MSELLPIFIALAVTAGVYLALPWWGFLIIFPWIGLSITIGLYLIRFLPEGRKGLGRKTSITLILPLMLLFIPIVNCENFQLEGVVLLLLVGYFLKGVIHYAIAKVFGPLIWGRGFCGWACWTAAVLEWLPIEKQGAFPAKLKNLRYLTLAISVLFPVLLVFGLNYDVRRNYIYRAELAWMLVGNAIYYLTAVPLAFYFRDKRAFCKIACPIAPIMKLQTRVALLKISPTEEKCIECGKCNKVCPMDIDVMSYIVQGGRVTDTECIQCVECVLNCPVRAIA